jgi:hypothetical protein
MPSEAVSGWRQRPRRADRNPSSASTRFTATPEFAPGSMIVSSVMRLQGRRSGDAPEARLASVTRRRSTADPSFPQGRGAGTAVRPGRQAGRPHLQQPVLAAETQRKAGAPFLPEGGPASSLVSGEHFADLALVCVSSYATGLPPWSRGCASGRRSGLTTSRRRVASTDTC